MLTEPRRAHDDRGVPDEAVEGRDFGEVEPTLPAADRDPEERPGSLSSHPMRRCNRHSVHDICAMGAHRLDTGAEHLKADAARRGEETQRRYGSRRRALLLEGD